MRTAKLWFVVSGVLLMATVLTGSLLLRNPRDQENGVRPPITLSSPVGALEIHLATPAKASLDGTHAPDGGQRESTIHKFSGLEPRTYQLKVFRGGHEHFQTVSVKSGAVTTVEVSLKSGQ